MRALAAACLLLLSAGCAARSSLEGFGLRAVALELSEENQAQLLHSGTEGSPVAARLVVDGAAAQGWASLAGQGSVSDIKRGYRFDVAGDRGALGFGSVRLSAQAQDRSYLRTLLGRRVFESVGVKAPEVEPVALYVQGRYAGLYLMIERIDEEFFERRGLREERVYRSVPRASDFGPRLIADPRGGMEEVLGGYHEPELSRLAEWAARPADAEGLALAGRLLDLDDWVGFVAATLFLVNCDSLNNNLYVWKARDDIRLRTLAWDWERAFDGSCTEADLRVRNRLVTGLLAHASFRARVDALLAELRTQRFPPAAVRALLAADAARIAAAYREDRILARRGKSLDEETDSLLGVYSSTL